MSGALAVLGLLATAWVTFAAGTSLAVALAWRLRARWFRGLHPALRSRLAWIAATVPTLVPTVLVLACLAPGLAGLLAGTGDHCLRHAEHPHLCLVHLPATLRGPLVAAGSLTAVALAFGFTRATARVARQRKGLALLGATASTATVPERHVVPSDHPFSFVAGLVRPKIWVASALEESLAADQLAVVLAHERAHAERRDPLRAATAAALSWPLWPSVRRAILGELALASEQTCDEAAALRLGDRLRVAEAILAVERLVHRTSTSFVPSSASAFGGSNVRARVQGLVGDLGAKRLPPWVPGAAIALVGVALPLGADALHHGMEHWIRLVLGLIQ
ncbi:MAG: M56 family metallopeptidase [Proteobacteria bacterium]|nr:M56 family metallopeptidase [Pseudomonadota bacterium]